jgi:hypothetical protein
MSYRLGESDLCNYGASRDENVDGRKSNSRIVCEKRLLFGALSYLVFWAKY